VRAGQRIDGAGRGFTLIELLVVTAILGLVLGVIAASLSAGIRAWEAARVFNAGESDALAALRMVRRDLAGTVPFGPIPLEGNAEDVRCAVRLRDSESGLGRLGTVRYRFDRSSGTLRRSRWPYPDADPGTAGEETLARHLGAWRVSYLPSPDGQWTQDWTGKTNSPAAVRFEAWTGPARTRLGETVVLRPSAKGGP
jgi:prepilin-type N-terminal cleavage/methylation domain-containing protein